MDKCFVCGNNAKIDKHLLIAKCDCPKCGSFAYELNFVTAYQYYFSSFNEDACKKISKRMKQLIKKGHICFVDDYETSQVEGYDLIEFRDVLNQVGLELAHNNTIDSNWKD